MYTAGAYVAAPPAAFPLPKPLLPVSNVPTILPTPAYTRAIPGVQPYRADSLAAASGEVAGLSNNVYMAPNFVYPCGRAGFDQCWTNTFEYHNADMQMGCLTNSTVCVDSVTRGLLSGLQPLLSTTETLFPEEQYM